MPLRYDTESDVHLTGPDVDLVADCAYNAGSEERGSAGAYILERLGGVVHADAAAILGWNPVARHHVLVSNVEYAPSTLLGLSEPYTDTDPHHEMLACKQPLRFADLPYDYRTSEFYEDVLGPAGFRDGLTTCLFGQSGDYVGMVHMSSGTRGTFDRRHSLLLKTIAPSIGRLCSPVRPRLTADTSSIAYMDGTGRSHAWGRCPAPVVCDEPEFILATARFLNSGRESFIGLWPTATSWLRVRMDRVDEPLWGPGVVALVATTPTRVPYGLTGREVDILTGVAHGMSNQQIASRYGISVRTTTAHVEKILHKLAERSRTGAAVRAIEEGLARLIP